MHIYSHKYLHALRPFALRNLPRRYSPGVLAHVFSTARRTNASGRLVCKPATHQGVPDPVALACICFHCSIASSVNAEIFDVQTLLSVLAPWSGCMHCPGRCSGSASSIGTLVFVDHLFDEAVSAEAS